MNNLLIEINAPNKTGMELRPSAPLQSCPEKHRLVRRKGTADKAEAAIAHDRRVVQSQTRCIHCDFTFDRKTAMMRGFRLLSRGFGGRCVCEDCDLAA